MKVRAVTRYWREAGRVGRPGGKGPRAGLPGLQGLVCRAGHRDSAHASWDQADFRGLQARS